MQYLGDYRIDDYISFGAQLHRFSSGAVYAPTGNVTYTFYEDNSTTGAPTGGNLAQLNSKTGLYTARVQLTAAAGFEAGKEYFIHIEATVDGVAAAELLMFRIVGNPKVDIDTIKTQSITCAAGVTVLANVGFAGAPGANNGAPTTNGTKINQTADLTAGQEIAANLTKVNGAAQTATLDTIKGDTAAILTDTGTTLDGKIDTIDGIVDSIKLKTDNLPASPAAVGSAMTLTAAYDAAKTAASQTSLDTVDGIVDAIKLKTDNLPADPADQSAVEAAITAAHATTNGKIDAVDDYIDTEVAAILADTNELQTDLANGGRLDLLIDAIKAKTDKLTYTSGNDLDVNVQKVNDTALTGNGSSGTPWGPA